MLRKARLGEIAPNGIGDAEQDRDHARMERERLQRLLRRVSATARLANDYHRPNEGGGEFLTHFIGDLVHDGMILAEEINEKRMVYVIRDCGTHLMSDLDNARAVLKVNGDNNFRIQWFKLVEEEHPSGWQESKSEWIPCTGKEAIAYLEGK